MLDVRYLCSNSLMKVRRCFFKVIYIVLLKIILSLNACKCSQILSSKSRPVCHIPKNLEYLFVACELVDFIFIPFYSFHYYQVFIQWATIKPLKFVVFEFGIDVHFSAQ